MTLKLIERSSAALRPLRLCVKKHEPNFRAPPRGNTKIESDPNFHGNRSSVVAVAVPCQSTVQLPFPESGASVTGISSPTLDTRTDDRLPAVVVPIALIARSVLCTFPRSLTRFLRSLTGFSCSLECPFARSVARFICADSCFVGAEARLTRAKRSRDARFPRPIVGANRGRIASRIRARPSRRLARFCPRAGRGSSSPRREFCVIRTAVIQSAAG